MFQSFTARKISLTRRPSFGSIADASLLALCQRTITLSFQRRISVTVTDGDISMALSLYLHTFHGKLETISDVLSCIALKKVFQFNLDVSGWREKKFNNIN